MTFGLNPNFIKVMYRKRRVDVTNFDKLDYSDNPYDFKFAWYDHDNHYLLVLLEDKVYHYTKVPIGIWKSLCNSSYAGLVYEQQVKGNFDARDGGIPVYEKLR